MNEKKHAFSLVTSNGKTYISGVKDESSWANKLINAGCTVTSKGDLKIPETAQNPLLFVESILGKDKIEKYGGIDFKSATKSVSQNEQKEKEIQTSLRVTTNQETNDLVVSGLSKEDKEAHKYIKSFGGKFDNNTSSWIIQNNDAQLKQNEVYKNIKNLLVKEKSVNTEDTKNQRLSFDEAAKYFENSSRAIKCLTTNTINAEVGDKLLKIIPSAGAYTLTPLSKWNLETIFDPNGEAYLKGKAFMLTTKDLTAALNQTSEIKTNFSIMQDGKDVLVSNEQLKDNRILLDSFKNLIRNEMQLSMKWDKTAFRIENSDENKIREALNKFEETNSLDSSILTILKDYKEEKMSDVEAANSMRALLASEYNQTQTLTQG